VKAAVCRKFGTTLTIEEVTIDDPAPGEVRVDIAACAICHSDIAYLDGAWGGPLPTIFGHEAAGTVVEIGAGVTSVTPGDTVVVTLVRSCGSCFYCELGDEAMCETTFRLDRHPGLWDRDGETINQGLRTAGFAQQVVVHESQLAAISEEMPMEAASLLACGVITGFGAVTNTARVPPGASVAVVGTGGVGLNCIQGAAYVGAGQVIAIDLNDTKLALAATLGATASINSAEHDAVAAVGDLTEGRGVDYVFVAAGSTIAVEMSLPLVRRSGTLVVVGMPPSGQLARIDTGDLAHQGQRIIGSKMGYVRVKRDIPMLAGLYASGHLKLDELITATYAPADINEAVRSARAGEAARNVIVFD
jgi:Zn-dependent alcohol dehydrogenase